MSLSDLFVEQTRDAAFDMVAHQVARPGLPASMASTIYVCLSSSIGI